MGLKFKSPLEISGHRAIEHSDNPQILIVKVVTKTAAHPYFGVGSTLGYTINGVESPYLEFTPGNTYRFDQSHSSNSGHPLRFYEDAAKTTSYTTGVTNNDASAVPGNSGAYTQIIPTYSIPPVLHYQCSNHGYMGSCTKYGTGTVGDTYSINATQDGSNVDLNLDAASGTDSTVQLNAGSNITLTRDNANQVTIASTASGGISGITIKEEGSALSTAATTLDFVGSGVTASGTGATKTITISGGGGSGGQVTTQKNISGDGTTQATDGSRTQFTISSTPASENNLQIYIDGVYQSKSDFSVSGTTVTLDAAPATGAVLEIIHFTVIDANIFLQSHTTANNSTTSFSAGGVIANENDTQVYIDGVYQSKSNYSVSGSNVVLSTAPATGAIVEIVNIKASASTSGSVTWETAIKTANFTAAAGKGYFVNTTSNTVTVSLPAGSSGDEIHFTDYASNFDTNELILSANGSQKILGETDDHKCITENATVRLIYQDDIKGWTADNIETTVVAVTVHYLVVAGGAGGGHVGGGGGGGYRTNNGGTALTLQPSTNYTVTVGAGGNASTSTSSPANATSGSNSVFATITSAGGGFGGANTAAHTNGIAADGGSGGGGGWDGTATQNAGGDGNVPNTTPSQGNDGGDGGLSHPYYAGGGGGGAGTAGSNAIYSGQAQGGAGGNGAANSISGTSVTYAGGGGGQGMQWTGGASGRTGGAGGSGGGGQGGGSTTPTDGGTNLGGGGGSPGYVTSGVGAGGSGVVILSYPSALTLTVPGGLTSSTATVGSNKVTTFTAGTGNVQFS